MKRTHKIYAILNMLVLVAIIFWNYWINAKGLNGNTMSSLSDEYINLFTPAAYAFSIWGIIFLALFAQALFFLKRAFSSTLNSDFLDQVGPFLLLTNIGNGAWIYFWLMEMTGISVLVMLGILTCLVTIIIRTNMERWDAPRATIFWLWWPICLYSGWIAVATIANISAYLGKNNWSGLGISELNWAVIMIVVAVLLNIFMVISRNMREFSLVGVWALIGIALRHWDEIPVLQYAALIGAVLLLIVSGIHGYKNRQYSPFKIRTTNEL